MSMLSLNMNINDCAVTVEFYWYGEDPDWETMIVNALLPSTVAPEAMYWVKVNDLLSDNDWNAIEAEIFWNKDKLQIQAHEQDY
jgi:hypothetical protein